MGLIGVKPQQTQQQSTQQQQFKSNPVLQTLGLNAQNVTPYQQNNYSPMDNNGSYASLDSTTFPQAPSMNVQDLRAGIDQKYLAQQQQDYNNALQGLQMRNQAFNQRPQGVTQIPQAVLDRTGGYNPNNFANQYQQYQQNQYNQYKKTPIGLADLLLQTLPNQFKKY